MDGFGGLKQPGVLGDGKPRSAAFDLPAAEARLRAAMDAEAARRAAAYQCMTARPPGFFASPDVSRLDATEARLRAAFEAEAARLRGQRWERSGAHAAGSARQVLPVHAPEGWAVHPVGMDAA